MRARRCSPERVVRWLWVLCLLMPLVCVWGAGSLFMILTERSHVIAQVAEGWIVHSLMVATPFAGLAYWTQCRGPKAPTEHLGRPLAAASVLGVICTTLIWGAFYYASYTYWAEQKDTGVPLGEACVMGISPAVIGGAMVLGLWLFGAKKNRGA